jgi:hypothetical protein
VSAEVEKEHFYDAIEWLKIEFELYQSKKWDDAEDDTWNLERWADQIHMYIKRGEVLTLENPLGRQAIAKAAATAVGMLQTIFRNYHWVPTPGVPSGEILGDFPKQDEPEHTI